MDEQQYDLRDMYIDGQKETDRLTYVYLLPGTQKFIKLVRDPYSTMPQVEGIRHKHEIKPYKKIEPVDMNSYGGDIDL